MSITNCELCERKWPRRNFTHRVFFFSPPRARQIYRTQRPHPPANSVTAAELSETIEAAMRIIPASVSAWGNHRNLRIVCRRDSNRAAANQWEYKIVLNKSILFYIKLAVQEFNITRVHNMPTICRGGGGFWLRTTTHIRGRITACVVFDTSLASRGCTW
jgi:hypothetical protein